MFRVKCRGTQGPNEDRSRAQPQLLSANAPSSCQAKIDEFATDSEIKIARITWPAALTAVVDRLTAGRESVDAWSSPG